MIRAALIIFLLLLFACKENTTSKKTKNKDHPPEAVHPKNLKERLFDSLVLFTDSAELLRNGDSVDYVLSIQEINGQKTAFIAITDSVLFFFNQIGNRWAQTDSILFDTYALSSEVKKLNKDDKDDFVIHGSYDAHGNSDSYVFLADSIGNLHYRKDIHLLNIDYDPATDFVRSYYEGGAREVHHKEIHRWVGDSLKLVRGAELDLSGERYTYVIFYKEKKGKRVEYKKIKDPSENIYDTAVWNRY